MMENNHKILQKALQKLPEYAPGEELWEKMETSLIEDPFNYIIPKLNKIEPPHSIWERIDHDLAFREKYSNIKLWAKWSIAAAAMIILGVIMFNIVNKNYEHKKYAEELLSHKDAFHWQDDDAIVAQTLSLICEAKPEVCRSPEFKKMKKELEYLDQSKQAVVKQLNKHNTDPELNLKLTRIELEQTEIINQMVASVN